MSKGTTVADHYEFRLSDELKSLAEIELRESHATRDFALRALREWIEANPRIAAARLGKLIFLHLFKFRNFNWILMALGFPFFLSFKMQVSYCDFCEQRNSVFQ